MPRQNISGTRVDWDEEKDRLLRSDPKRGFSIQEVAESLFAQECWHGQKNDNPLQYQLIGWVREKLITLIYETKDDEDGDYEFLRTYWRTTKAERKQYGI